LSETTDTQELDTATEEEREWDELEDEELPPRPRNRLLRPLPMALLAVLIAALGFLGGVLVQKGSGESSASGFPGGGLPSIAGASGASGSGGSGEGEGATASIPSFGGSEAAATGTVSSVDGKTIYVKESDGTVVAVKAEDGSTITRDSEVGAKAIHPGDTVVVEGSKHGSTVKASSISATEAGVESASAGSPGGGESEGGTSVESLFAE